MLGSPVVVATPRLRVSGPYFKEGNPATAMHRRSNVFEGLTAVVLTLSQRDAVWRWPSRMRDRARRPETSARRGASNA